MNNISEKVINAEKEYSDGKQIGGADLKNIEEEVKKIKQL